MPTETPLTPWTREEMKAHAYVTATQMRTPSSWNDEPKDEYDLIAALNHLRNSIMVAAGVPA